MRPWTTSTGPSVGSSSTGFPRPSSAVATGGSGLLAGVRSGVSGGVRTTAVGAVATTTYRPPTRDRELFCSDDGPKLSIRLGLCGAMLVIIDSKDHVRGAACSAPVSSRARGPSPRTTFARFLPPSKSETDDAESVCRSCHHLGGLRASVFGRQARRRNATTHLWIKARHDDSSVVRFKFEGPDGPTGGRKHSGQRPRRIDTHLVVMQAMYERHGSLVMTARARREVKWYSTAQGADRRVSTCDSHHGDGMPTRFIVERDVQRSDRAKRPSGDNDASVARSDCKCLFPREPDRVKKVATTLIELIGSPVGDKNSDAMPGYLVCERTHRRSLI